MRDTRLDPLPSELRRRREQAAAEAQAGIEWIDGCPVTVGTEVLVALEELTNISHRVLQRADNRLGGTRPNSYLVADLLAGEGTDEDRLDALAAVVGAFVWLGHNDNELIDSYSNRPDYAPEYSLDTFIEVVNDRLLHARVNWLFEDGRFQERGNSVMHSEVLRPATLLLGDDPAFSTASDAFQSALTRLSKGETDVALTQAATALQEFFRALGVNGGNSVSDQLDHAQRQNIISPVDRALMKPLIDWVNGDRSERGNAHRHREGDVSKADAWLMMHVVGAVMVRLSNREPRDIVAAREQREAAATAVREEQARVEREAAVVIAPTDPWSQQGQYGDETPF